MSAFSQADRDQLAAHGLPLPEAERQLALLRQGTKPVRLQAPATVGRGILAFDRQTQDHYAGVFSRHSPSLAITRFVPASGAATRMFKAVVEYHSTGRESPDIEVLRERYRMLPFYDRIACRPADFDCSMTRLLEESGLPGQPKALIPFHRYGNEARTAFVEHLYESVRVAPAGALHFTISPAHEDRFETALTGAGTALKQKTGQLPRVTFSFQSPATDTLAADSRGELVREANGRLLLRPGGHGSLLSNLQQLQADLIFIKNIDNIQPERQHPHVAFYKQVLAGLLIELQQHIFTWLQELETGAGRPEEIAGTLTGKWQIHIPDSYHNLPEGARSAWLYEFLNRPLRVCGMVRNQGQPGGGPFWVRHEEGEVSLQIVETSQIDTHDPQQAGILQQATHFNPVDIVCTTRNYRGQIFDLARFTDPGTAFITEKTYAGRPIRVLEHPGLWNGGMAGWFTLFVEVPETTFAPVKTINDLVSPVRITT